MDIFSHTFSGMAAGGLVGICLANSPREKLNCLLMGTLGGAIPDLDALSLWDPAYRLLVAVSHTNDSPREIYYGTYWYSHHAALHSIFSAFIFIFFAQLISRWRISGTKKLDLLKINPIQRNSYLAFFLGYLLHLLQDMPTPPGPWGGINLWFPLRSYYGGYGQIWWWNNYDLFLIIFFVAFTNILILILFKKPKSWIKIFSIGLFLLSLFIFIFQINHRSNHYGVAPNPKSYKDREQASKEEQKQILGDRLYYIMESIDNRIPLYF